MKDHSYLCNWPEQSISLEELQIFPKLSLIPSIGKPMFRLLTRMVQLTRQAIVFSLQDAQPTSTSSSGASTSLKMLGALFTENLVMSRNEVQHRLLSFPISQYPTEYFATVSSTGDNSALTELTRLAASVFSDMAFFPLPWRTGVKLRLAARMRAVWRTVVPTSRGADGYVVVAEAEARPPGCGAGCGRAMECGGYCYGLGKCPGRSGSGTIPVTWPVELLVWILWYGCLAAVRTEHQGWFEEEMLCVLEVLYGGGGGGGVREDCCAFGEGQKEGYGSGGDAMLLGENYSYEMLKAGVLEGFLWWDLVCEDVSRALWERLMARRASALW
jgi:hypothetical protein